MWLRHRLHRLPSQPPSSDERATVACESLTAVASEEVIFDALPDAFCLRIRSAVAAS